MTAKAPNYLLARLARSGTLSGSPPWVDSPDTPDSETEHHGRPANGHYYTSRYLTNGCKRYPDCFTCPLPDCEWQNYDD